jgi:Iron-containing redox enzyme
MRAAPERGGYGTRALATAGGQRTAKGGAIATTSPSVPRPRGPITAGLIEQLGSNQPKAMLPDVGSVGEPLADDDLQLALYLCYELHYRGLEGVSPEWEWSPPLLEFRSTLERMMLEALAEEVGPPEPPRGGVGELVFELVEADEAPSLSAYIEVTASLEEFREFVIHRSAYQLKEADPHSWAIPRLAGTPKAALVEIQADEYGGGDPNRVHATLYAQTMDALGLDSTYGAYVDRLPGTTLATVNLMSLFGLHRRWRGAIVGHLAAFEVSSPRPNGRYANGLRRLGFEAPATEFFDEHVEADSVHENIAAYDLAGGLASMEPGLAGDILFGIRALLLLDGRFAELLLEAWRLDESSLLAAAPSVRS